jgi:hypothetical protein
MMQGRQTVNIASERKGNNRVLEGLRFWSYRYDVTANAHTPGMSLAGLYDEPS